jgi:hypothetical protein
MSCATGWRVDDRPPPSFLPAEGNEIGQRSRRKFFRVHLRLTLGGYSSPLSQNAAVPSRSAPFIDAGGDQRVALQIDRVALIGGRGAHIADRHRIAAPDMQILFANGSSAPGPVRRLDNKPGMAAAGDGCACYRPRPFEWR